MEKQTIEAREIQPDKGTQKRKRVTQLGRTPEYFLVHAALGFGLG